MTDPAFPPIVSAPKRTATDLSFEALYQAVIALELPPGAKVSEAEIAKALDVSRQPVRDAFYRLSKLGFLSMRPQRATLVTKISKRAVLNAIFVRTALEVEALRTAIIPALEQALVETQAAYQRGHYGYLDYVSARQELLSARRTQIEAAAAALTYGAEIEQLTAEPLALTQYGEDNTFSGTPQ